jgi:hypothetical protein
MYGRSYGEDAQLAGGLADGIEVVGVVPEALLNVIRRE